MSNDPPHKAAFLAAVHENADAPYFLIGYVAGEVPDHILCEAIQAWRRHLAELADLERPREAIGQTSLYDPRD